MVSGQESPGFVTLPKNAKGTIWQLFEKHYLHDPKAKRFKTIYMINNLVPVDAYAVAEALLNFDEFNAKIQMEFQHVLIRRLKLALIQTHSKSVLFRNTAKRRTSAILPEFWMFAVK